MMAQQNFMPNEVMPRQIDLQSAMDRRSTVERGLDVEPGAVE